MNNETGDGVQLPTESGGCRAGENHPATPARGCGVLGLCAGLWAGKLSCALKHCSVLLCSQPATLASVSLQGQGDGWWQGRDKSPAWR